ncbi:ATP-dependent DNA helicase PIF1-like [Solanum pennellii]|uniref:ATP-dependent DNA helicase n=1 Tax=Solanum pennellii TaxID=28526 RepID=A0ABM1V579_SOLPN|nr:ATP-dependent DNA helicase PIF1-like [Solanum pennellii]
MLTEYFRMCSIDSEAKTYLYREFPKYYVWNSKVKTWTKRKTRSVIGRIAIANPREGERYYERLLLNHVRGPLSFNDLLTVNGKQCQTFKEAAKERGLLESDNSISECMREAVVFKMPFALRSLFATILVHCNPTDIRKLWDTYYEDMSEDFSRLYGNSHNTILQSTLNSINNCLQSMGKSIDIYDIPQLDHNFLEVGSSECREINEEMSVQIPPEDIDAQSQLNPEQHHAFTKIMQTINAGTTAIFFVDGPGGTGKTYLYRALLANVRSRGMIGLATATSGVAASILPGGRTAHSRFEIPLQTSESTMTNMSKQSGVAKLIRKAKVIIWDEAPMAKRQTIETVDRSFRDIMDIDKPFGGKVMVFGGDFRQVLPVVPKSTRAEIVNASLVKSYLWPLMEKIQFTRNMRARTDPTFSEFLLRVGNGDEPTIRENLILLPEQLTIKHSKDEIPEESIIKEIFQNLQENAATTKYVTERAILASRNDHVDKINNKLISQFPGESKIFNSFDSAEDDTNNYYQEEYLNTLTPNGLPPHRLELKENAPIMLLRNLDPSSGLCNGTRMICRGFSQNVLHAEISSGHSATKHVFLPRIQLSPPENEGYPFKFIRKQFPIRLCFAMTINKAQGQTIHNVGLYLPQHVFSHGQLYVALSRGISMSTTKVLVLTEQPKCQKGTYTKNIVYKEVLGLEDTSKPIQA